MAKKKLYYMHPINTYGTELEHKQLWMLRVLFPEYVIINPNEEKHARRYENYKKAFGNGMLYFKRLASRCHAGVALSFQDGAFGAGICKEVSQLLTDRAPVWEINWACQLYKLNNIEESRRLTVDETRARIRNPDGSTKPY